MLRFARLYAADAAVAEDCFQDAWLGVVRGLRRFEGRASLRTWILSILLNRLKARLKRERRLIPFSRRFDAASAPAEPAVEPEHFLPGNHPRWQRHWNEEPASWGVSPEEHLLREEVRTHIERAIAGLAPAQREVITLRDVRSRGPLSRAPLPADVCGRLMRERVRE